MVAHKPWYAMTGSQVHETSSPMKSRCHMYHQCHPPAFQQGWIVRLQSLHIQATLTSCEYAEPNCLPAEA